jgi:hypothetical protein
MITSIKVDDQLLPGGQKRRLWFLRGFVVLEVARGDDLTHFWA